MADDRGPTGAGETPLRRTPRQARSRQKLALVLEAADRLLAAEG
ncbi:TetR family transcriptional regulator, partial [Actinoplanes sp. ATCC 53533]